MVSAIWQVFPWRDTSVIATFFQTRVSIRHDTARGKKRGGGLSGDKERVKPLNHHPIGRRNEMVGVWRVGRGFQLSVLDCRRNDRRSDPPPKFDEMPVRPVAWQCYYLT